MHSTRDSDLVEKLRPNVLTLRIIVAALATGVLVFAAVAMVIRAGGNMQPRAANLELITIMAIAWTPVGLILSRLVPALMSKTARANIVSGAGLAASNSQFDLLTNQYLTNSIIAAALLEGAAFFNLVGYLLEGHPATLGLGIGLALVILSLFPSAPRMTHWIEQQARIIAEEKSLR
jgi:hypothetical protein